MPRVFTIVNNVSELKLNCQSISNFHNTPKSFAFQQFPLSRAPRWAPFIMNFCGRLSSTVSNQSQRGYKQSDTKPCNNAVGRHQVFLRTWKRRLRLCDSIPQSRNQNIAWPSGLGSRGGPVTVRPETKRK